MCYLVVSYHLILRQHEISWPTNSNAKVAVNHEVLAVCPEPSRTRLQADITFAYNSLKTDFHAFIRHTIRLAEAFSLSHIDQKAKKWSQIQKNHSRNDSNKNDVLENKRQRQWNLGKWLQFAFADRIVLRVSDTSWMIAQTTGETKKTFIDSSRRSMYIMNLQREQEASLWQTKWMSKRTLRTRKWVTNKKTMAALFRTSHQEQQKWVFCTWSQWLTVYEP